MMVDLHGRDLLTLQDFTSEEIYFILQTALDLKRKQKRNEPHKLLEGKALGMIFQKPSTRTRVSFEMAMHQLGGTAIYLGWKDLQLGRGETIADTARVLSRYVDGIMARVFSHNDLIELAKYSKVPVINGLSDMYHPCQILADLLTILEKKGSLKGIKLTYVGDGNNVCNSLLIGATKMGMNIFVATPQGYEPPKEVIDLALANSKKSGSTVKILNDPIEAVKNADVIYTDVWVSMGMEEEKEKRMKVFPPYQVNQKLLSHAKDDVIVMHCLPAHRGLEITDDVIDGKHSVVWDEAENRLHAQKALLALTL
ncbi:MAG: ornithine carbamoyltransferase [Candidatus Asgardarchaeum californiense]|nr:MAG: ornithine carbamoyltransferase [Candidatus Asgardarchaeum californiense]